MPRLLPVLSRPSGSGQMRPVRKVQVLVMPAVMPVVSMMVVPAPVVMPVPMMAVMPMPTMMAVPSVVAHLNDASVYHPGQPNSRTEVSGFGRNWRPHEQS